VLDEDFDRAVCQPFPFSLVGSFFHAPRGVPAHLPSLLVCIVSRVRPLPLAVSQEAPAALTLTPSPAFRPQDLLPSSEVFSSRKRFPPESCLPPLDDRAVGCFFYRFSRFFSFRSALSCPPLSLAIYGEKHCCLPGLGEMQSPPFSFPRSRGQPLFVCRELLDPPTPPGRRAFRIRVQLRPAPDPPIGPVDLIRRLQTRLLSSLPFRSPFPERLRRQERRSPSLRPLIPSFGVHDCRVCFFLAGSLHLEIQIGDFKISL